MLDRLHKFCLHGKNQIACIVVSSALPLPLLHLHKFVGAVGHKVLENAKLVLHLFLHQCAHRVDELLRLFRFQVQLNV
jgi:hypothetical protein